MEDVPHYFLFKGFIAKDGPLKTFEIAGPDGKYVRGKAVIKGDNVIVGRDSISNPIAIRYDWTDTLEGAILYSKEDSPASPSEAKK